MQVDYRSQGPPMTADAAQRTAPETIQLPGLDPARLPRHLAIIMDGNGRWARRQGWVRVRGHRQGASVVRDITTECARLGVGRLTLYAFSSENWSRPQREIDYLMDLLADFLDAELATLQENDIRFQVIGQFHRLPERVRAKAQRNIAATVGNSSMTLCLALSYGGRDEILDACRQLARRAAAGELHPDAIDEEQFVDALYAPEAEDVDLLIRTAGEQRISNFLPWQSVYAEYLSITPCWPEFSIDVLHQALREYQSRERRFGKV